MNVLVALAAADAALATADEAVAAAERTVATLKAERLLAVAARDAVFQGAVVADAHTAVFAAR